MTAEEILAKMKNDKAAYNKAYYQRNKTRLNAQAKERNREDRRLAAEYRRILAEQQTNPTANTSFTA